MKESVFPGTAGYGLPVDELCVDVDVELQPCGGGYGVHQKADSLLTHMNSRDLHAREGRADHLGE